MITNAAHVHDDSLATAYGAVVTAPFGAIGIRVADGMVRRIACLAPDTAMVAPRGGLAARVARQVQRYLADPDFTFDLPLAPSGSVFQQRVWHAVADIPRGQMRSYGALARQLGTSARAVGQACSANCFALVVPCHRVVANAGLGGFVGDASASDDIEHAQVQQEMKRWLLAHEGVRG
jgi:methylated-DNA-[protein]-cysteine S-methyltransferase